MANTNAVLIVPTNKLKTSVCWQRYLKIVLLVTKCTPVLLTVILKDFISAVLIPYFQHDRTFFIIDYCRFQHCKNFISLPTTNGIVYKFLPPNPILNTIEEVFGVLKAKYNALRLLYKTENMIILRISGVIEQFIWNF